MVSLNLGWLLVAVAIAVILRRYLSKPHGPSTDDVIRIADELRALSNEAVKRVANSRIALGYNANLDGVTKATEVLGEFLASTLHGPIQARDHAKISSELELAECFLHFFSAGAAAERFVDRALFDRLVSAVRASKHTALSPGGNAALMANRVAALGGSPLLGGPVGPSLRALLHANIRTVIDVSVENDAERQAKRDAVVDEFHLIFEYNANETFPQQRSGAAVSPRANRFILHSDDNNGRIDGLELFHRALRRFQPTMVVVAGLHLLQEQKASFRTSRIADLRSQLCSVPLSVAVHFEFASIGDKAFVRELATTLLADVDSMGMNEQELADLYVALGGKTRTATEIARGDQHAVLHAIAFLFASADSIVANQSLRTCASRRLTRIHFHYLTYHIIATRGERWNGTAEAAAAGSWATTSQACGLSSSSTDNNNNKYNNKHQPFSGSALVELRVSVFETVWNGHLLNVLGRSHDEKLSDANFTLVPVLVCKRPLRTVGLGDAISATALVTQQFLQQSLP